MSGGCDRQKTDEDEIIEAHDVRLRRERDEALLKASKATAALVAARQDLEKARSERDEARLDVERRAQDARDAAGRAGVAYAHLESILRGEREAHVRTRADREAAERRIQEASVRLDALAALLRTTALDRGRDVFAALAALERALRGVTPIEAPIAGPWIEISPGEWRRRIEGSPRVFAAAIGPHPDDPKVLVWCAWRPGGGTFAERDTALDLQAAKDACDAALVRAGWELASVKAGSIEDRLTAVEARIADLDKRLAGANERIDVALGAAVATHDKRPRVSWRWADGATSGWLTTVTGEQIASANEGIGGWYWWAREWRGKPTSYTGPMTREDAIQCAEGAASKIAVIVR